MLLSEYYLIFGNANFLNELCAKREIVTINSILCFLNPEKSILFLEVIEWENVKKLWLSGSIRESSINTNILENLASFFEGNIDYSIYDKIGEFPHFNPDLDNEEGPKVIEEFRQELNEADALIFCTPEYARGIPGVLKNAIDWLVSSGQLLNKTVAVITASPMVSGGEKAQTSFLQTLEMLNANVVKNGTLVISSVGTKLNSKGEAIDKDTRFSLELLIESIITEIKKKKAPLV